MIRKKSFLGVITFLLIAIFCLLALGAPAFAEEGKKGSEKPEAGIVRSFSTENPAPGEEFTVSLEVSGLKAAGVVETLPEGFVYIESLSPGEAQVNVSGQNLVFSVLDDEKITYKVKAPASGKGIFEGEWKDFLNGAEGRVQPSELKVKPRAKPSKTGLASEKAPVSEKSPFGSESLLFGGLAALKARSRAQKKKNKRRA
ncbi:MAG: hypothetical protein PHD26_04280 [Methanosarcinaceae archaeon]|nr:hypothetical protein [Methanosarcinaceae archaeon]